MFYIQRFLCCFVVCFNNGFFCEIVFLFDVGGKTSRVLLVKEKLFFYFQKCLLLFKIIFLITVFFFLLKQFSIRDKRFESLASLANAVKTINDGTSRIVDLPRKTIRYISSLNSQ
jgi:hypothetical protein